MHAGEDALDALVAQAEDVAEQIGEQRAVVGQHGIVAVLKQMGLLDLDLLAENAAAIDAAAEQ